MLQRQARLDCHFFCHLESSRVSANLKQPLLILQFTAKRTSSPNKLEIPWYRNSAHSERVKCRVLSKLVIEKRHTHLIAFLRKQSPSLHAHARFPSPANSACRAMLPNESFVPLVGTHILNIVVRGSLHENLHNRN